MPGAGAVSFSDSSSRRRATVAAAAAASGERDCFGAAWTRGPDGEGDSLFVVVVDETGAGASFCVCLCTEREEPPFVDRSESETDERDDADEDVEDVRAGVCFMGPDGRCCGSNLLPKVLERGGDVEFEEAPRRDPSSSCGTKPAACAAAVPAFSRPSCPVPRSSYLGLKLGDEAEEARGGLRNSPCGSGVD